MRRTALCTAFVVIATVALMGTAGADLVQTPRSDFIEPAILGFAAQIIPNLIGLPVDLDVGALDCGGGELGLELHGSLTMDNPGVGIFWIGEGLAPLKVEAGVANTEFDLDIYIVADGCLWGLINGYLPFPGTHVSVEQFAIGFNSIPYLNTDTDEIVLETDFGESQVVFAGLELFGDFLGLDEILEAVIEGLVRDYLEEFLMDDGDLATTGDGGIVHQVTESYMDTIYRPHLCGCITMTTGKPTAGHLISNSALYLLPLGLILGLKRRMNRS